MDKETIATDLLWPLWRGIPAEYKQKYARNIWTQYEDNIRSAAYTSKLGAFYDRISRRLSLHLRSEDIIAVERVIGSGDDRAVLKMLRDETIYLVLLVRLKNDERKAAFQDRQEELF